MLKIKGKILVNVGNQNVNRGNSPTKDRKFLERLIQTDRKRLLEMLWYVQYCLPFDQREDKQDDGLRAFVCPVQSLLLPTIPVVPEWVEIDEKCTMLQFWSKYVEPQRVEARLMLSTFESMYRSQQAVKENLGKITFHLKLSERNFVQKLNYAAYRFPDHPKLFYDYVCPDCGQVIQHNFVLDPTPICKHE